ncbi:MAG: decaprenyl-phosphate phosphoribosyltransferase [Muribaculaceae bacterium]|nr:decaprenyl-phosphate phosphoribosyltransferase [Muribaculaceae bacterium]
MLGSLFSLMRPHQWIKNIFVLIPLFFGGKLFDLLCWREAILAAIAFSFMASAVYCINDLHDLEADRRHPKKKNRPLASGKIRPVEAIFLAVILVLSSFAISYFMLAQAGPKVSLVLLFYFILNILYCFKLKQYAIIDVFIVSFGFVLRLMAGGIACGIWLSPWIVLMTFLIALFLAFAKRRDDVVLYKTEQIKVRKNVIRYNLSFLNQTLGLIGAITIVCYIMYSVSPEVEMRFDNRHVYVTSIFVLAAILRYLQVAIVDQRSGSPTKVLLRDRFIQVCLLLWSLSFVIILYL